LVEEHDIVYREAPGSSDGPKLLPMSQVRFVTQAGGRTAAEQGNGDGTED
jgi:hypothetical protein